MFFAAWESQFADGNGEAIMGQRFILASPTPTPILRITESHGLADDNIVPFGRVTIGGTIPVRTIQFMNLGTVL